MIWDVPPGSGSRFFPYPGSRIQGLKKHRIPDLVPGQNPEQCITCEKILNKLSRIRNSYPRSGPVPATGVACLEHNPASQLYNIAGISTGRL
jgi:hypothetical protein